MSGIGDYIHYKKSNYRKFGTYINNDNNNSNYSQALKIFQNQREQVKERVYSTSSSYLSEIELFLNGMMYGTNADQLELDQKCVQQMQNSLEKVIAEKYPMFAVNFNNELNIYYKPSFTSAQKKSIQLSTLNRYLDTITQLANGNIKMNSKGNLDQILQVRNQLETYINSFSSGVDPKTTINLHDNTKLANFLPEINAVLKMQSIPRAAAIGDVFEYWLALASQYCEGLTEKKANDIIDKFVKGAERSSPTISLRSFSKDYVNPELLMNSSAFSSGWQYLDDNNSFKFNKPTQDKLDVAFQWKGDTLNVTAKNYLLRDNSSMIHLVSGTSLLYLISSEDNIDFINHWLNVVSGSNSDFINESYLQQAHAAMKMTIFIKALTGQGTSRMENMSDTFILNNRTKKHIFVRSTKAVVNAADNILDEIRFKGYPNRIPNIWVGKKNGALSKASAEQRISNLIAKLHTYNLTVTMPFTVIEKPLNN